MSDDKSQRNRLSCWRLHSAYFLAYKCVTQKRLKYNVMLNLILCVTLKRDASHKCDKIEISKKNFNKRWQKICGVSLSSMITFCSIFQWTSIYLAIKYVTQAMQCYHFQIRNQLFLDGSTGFCTKESLMCDHLGVETDLMGQITIRIRLLRFQTTVDIY